MPTADYTVASPTPQAVASYQDTLIGNQVDAAQTRNDSAERVTYNNDVYSQRTLPQLQSGMGATGQWYSGAARNQEKFAAQDITQSNYDVTSAMQRHLNDLDRQRMFASIGLIV